MGKSVVVVASGETERRALPHLLSGIGKQGISLDEIRIPPGNRALSAKVCEKIIKAVWYEKMNTSSLPDKFVILLDSDREDPIKLVGDIRSELTGRISEVNASIQYAYACQHLEAWYFADANNLRKFLARGVGNIDVSKPDDIQNPKGHLKNILGKRIYTAQLSEEIAQALDSNSISNSSPSFRGLVAALVNGIPK